MPGATPLERFIASAKADGALWDSLVRASADLGEAGHLIDQEFLCQGFSTSNRSAFATVKKVFRLAAHGVLVGAPSVPAAGLEPPSTQRWLDQAFIDLRPWDLVEKTGKSSGRLLDLGRRVLENFLVSSVAIDEPEGRTLTEFNFRFFKVIEQYASERPPNVWRSAKQQADRMIVFAATTWPGETLASDQTALLDFLSCEPLKTRGGREVGILRWRDAWASASTWSDWGEVSRQLSRAQGRLSDPDGRQLAPLLWRYFKPDEKGSDRIVGLTYDVFRFLTNAPNVGEPATDIPPDARPIGTRDAIIKVRQRSEPDRLKKLVGYRCQFESCRGAIERPGRDSYVESAHLRPFRDLSVDGIPGNYLITCPHHHKAIDEGSPKFRLDPSVPPAFVEIEVQEMDGSRKWWKVTPHPRQLAYGFQTAVRWRIDHAG